MLTFYYDFIAPEGIIQPAFAPLGLQKNLNKRLVSVAVITPNKVLARQDYHSTTKKLYEKVKGHIKAQNTRNNKMALPDVGRHGSRLEKNALRAHDEEWMEHRLYLEGDDAAPLWSTRYAITHLTPYE
ncbi:unnamed protein product, partial [Amoebophrya sp. A25]|eukprot:GSA25T00008468001.1